MGQLTRDEMRTELYLLMRSADEFDPTVAAGQARCDRFLNISYKRLQLPKVFDHQAVQSSQVVTLVTSTASYTLTIGPIYDIQYVQSSSFNRRLRPMTRAQMNALVRAGGPPTRFAHWSNTLYLDCIPSAAENGQTLNVFGWSLPISLATSSAGSILGDEWDEVIYVGAAWRAWRSLGDHAMADTFREEYAALVNDQRSTLDQEGFIQGWSSEIGSGDNY